MRGDSPPHVTHDLAASAGRRGELDRLAAANKDIERANAEVAELKKKSAAADQKVIEQELRHLRNVQIRHEPETAAFCDEYSAAVADKTALEEEKKKVRALGLTRFRGHRNYAAFFCCMN